jgi:ribosomal protein S18 acetylase RimI-like enzyme
VLDELTRLDGRPAVLAAAADHPYARLTTGGHATVTGYAGGALLAWVSAGTAGPVGCALGPAPAAVRLLAALRGDGPLAGAAWLHLPRADRRMLATHLPVSRHDDWEFRWSTTPPPPRPDEERVVRLRVADEPAVADLLRTAFPDSTSWPGDPQVRAWYGVRDGGAVVACGADRSRGGVGFLAGVAVHPAHRGRGLGAALAGGLARRLHAEHGTVALGVMADNAPALELYARLGFTAGAARTSVRLG